MGFENCSWIWYVGPKDAPMDLKDTLSFQAPILVASLVQETICFLPSVAKTSFLRQWKMWVNHLGQDGQVTVCDDFSLIVNINLGGVNDESYVNGAKNRELWYVPHVLNVVHLCVHIRDEL